MFGVFNCLGFVEGSTELFVYPGMELKVVAQSVAMAGKPYVPDSSSRSKTALWNERSHNRKEDPVPTCVFE
jgi:hypothetical protein